MRKANGYKANALLFDRLLIKCAGHLGRFGERETTPVTALEQIAAIDELCGRPSFFYWPPNLESAPVVPGTPDKLSRHCVSALSSDGVVDRNRWPGSRHSWTTEKVEP